MIRVRKFPSLESNYDDFWRQNFPKIIFPQGSGLGKELRTPIGIGEIQAGTYNPGHLCHA